MKSKQGIGSNRRGEDSFRPVQAFSTSERATTSKLDGGHSNAGLGNDSRLPRKFWAACRPIQRSGGGQGWGREEREQENDNNTLEDAAVHSTSRNVFEPVPAAEAPRQADGHHPLAAWVPDFP